MKHSALFDQFLVNINPNVDAVGYAQDAHTRVRKCLEGDEKFGQYVTGHFLYGSYKRHTAVGDIKDVDVVILTDFDVSDHENSPAKVLRKLKAALARCYEDPDNPEYQRRSIRVNDPLPDKPDVELTLDIIPAVAMGGEDNPLWVPDKEQKVWIQSHPKGHLNKVTEANTDDFSGGRFVPLAKIMKWWWKYQCSLRQPSVERPKPKGFWVECLTLENFNPEQASYAEHFIATLESILQKYGREAMFVPQLKDPGLSSQIIKTSMEPPEFEVFMTAVDESLATAKQALLEDDPVISSELWRDIFGESFPLYDAEETDETRKSVKGIQLGDVSHVQPLMWPLDRSRRYKVRVDAHLYNRSESKQLAGLNSGGRQISSGLRIRYRASTNVPGSYELYWQVVNTGAHARQVGGLRGKLFKGSWTQWESTLYTGKHWIQCFIVKDGWCVAFSERFYVNIWNPEFQA